MQPIGQLSVIFRLIFAWFLNREYEVFDARAIIAVLVSFAGAMLLATSVEIFPGLETVPGILHGVLTWK